MDWIDAESKADYRSRTAFIQRLVEKVYRETMAVDATQGEDGATCVI